MTVRSSIWNRLDAGEEFKQENNKDFINKRFRYNYYKGSNSGSSDTCTDSNDDCTKGEPTSRWNILKRLHTRYHDIQISINESFELIDWEDIANRFANPIGYSLLCLFFVVKFIQENFIRPSYNKIYRYRSSQIFNLNDSETFNYYKDQFDTDVFSMIDTSSAYYGRPNDEDSMFIKLIKWINNFCNSLVVLLIFINIVISYQFLNGYYRRYSLFYTTKRPTNTLSIVKKNKKDLEIIYNEDVLNLSFFRILKYYFFNKENDLKTKNSYQPTKKTILNDETYYELSKWLPNTFIRKLFVSYSPTSVLLLLNSNDISFLTIFWLVANQILIYYLIEIKYENRIIDEQMLYREMMNEYSMKTKQPTARLSQNVKLDTSSYPGGGYVEFIDSNNAIGNNNNIFKRHDLNGRAHYESFDKRTDQFEELRYMPDYSGTSSSDNTVIPSLPHNIIRVPPMDMYYHSFYSRRNSPYKWNSRR
ncbi:hypothetical protein TBLA_0B09600 [Henningerozyma blattae CBS 6284]|uniref:Nuclear rim protein 1 n=1 Tax=Henningerozyma blattae (strain ATCC 34711 / CBS 6284 / DSM 70876 / NBRC 10599 / NRRL Y-10934 / UCD 77-7) TaxID=1071380 RepID=I2H075_HENB6|nr:hypothetical protein TBLA_0B09600 [Tetrapisispora blattae CBS 6284]CCH59777.1 hypothetical protein TBLA_0B09600 [Tetrapisispora blattae CBS 6284]